MPTASPCNPRWKHHFMTIKMDPSGAGKGVTTNGQSEHSWDSPSDSIPVVLSEKPFLNVSYKRSRIYEVTAGQSMLKMGVRVDAFPRPNVTWYVGSSFLAVLVSQSLLFPPLQSCSFNTSYWGPVIQQTKKKERKRKEKRNILSPNPTFQGTHSLKN